MALSKFHFVLSLGNLAVTVFFVRNVCAEPRPYQLSYAVYRNGKLVGQAEANMQQQGERWSIRGAGSGTRGLGRLLGVTDEEQVEGYFLDGRFRPDRFSHHSRLAGFSDDWSAQFNWQDNTVAITKDDDVLSLDMGPGALDKLSVKVELQRRLREQDPNLQFFEVRDDEIKPQTYRALPAQQLDTSLGCLNTIPVELVTTGTTSYSRSWQAPDLDFLTVRLERGKTDGVHLDMRISAMVLDGKKINPQAPCSVPQSGSSSADG